MNRPLRNRRSFLQDLAMGIAVAPFVTRGLMAQSPNSKVRHATIGCAGMGLSDIKEIGKHESVEVVAGCDIDSTRTEQFLTKFPNARIYSDYRELFDKEKDLQSVNVSTPDHMHGPIGAAALKRGLHLYGQKPLTHNLYECRRLTELARETKRVTQMGIQVHSSSEYFSVVKILREGIIGKVKEVHTFCGKTWGDNDPMPTTTEQPPATTNWDLWLGVAKDRPFIGGDWYHPNNWRKRVDFGVGTLGDMACHLFDPLYAALDLTVPVSIRSEGPKPSEHSWATGARVHYVFPGTAFTADSTLKVSWYDGEQLPPKEILEMAIPKDDQFGVMEFKKEEGKPLSRDKDPMQLPELGSIIVGTKGVMVLPHYGNPRVIGSGFKDYIIPKIAGANHWYDFIETVMGNRSKARTNFDYAGPLTEAVLLGSVAARFPQTTLQWNSAKLEFTNEDAANAYIRSPYRKGWEASSF